MKCTKEEFEIIVKICERAEAMNIAPKERITLIMDLDNLHADMGLNLEAFLAGDDSNFAHDIVGIQNHMNRSTGKLEDFFVPRYAQQKDFDINAVIDKAKASADKHNSSKAAEKNVREKDITE